MKSPKARSGESGASGRTHAVVEPPAGFDPWVKTYAEAAGQPNGINESIDAWKAWCAAQRILEHRDTFEGNGTAVLAGIGLALQNGVMPPPWLVKAFLRCWDRFESLEVRSLDEAFEHAPPTKRKADAIKRRRALIPEVHRLLAEAIYKNPNEPIVVDLFDKVAEKIGISRTLCEELYREAVALKMGDLKIIKDGIREFNLAESRKSASLQRRG